MPAQGSHLQLAAMVSEAVRSRWSCRGFLEDEVSQEEIRRIIADAQRAASWCNSQPWQLIVTSGEETDRFRDALHAHASTLGWANQKDRPERPDIPFPSRYTGAYDDRRKATGWALYESVGIKPGDREASGIQMLENFRFFGAPHVAVITTERDLGTYGAVDCGSFLATFMLLAQSRGIATIAQAALAGCAQFVRDYFDIPVNRMILCGVSFGYPDPDHPANAFRTVRANIADVATFKG